MKEQQGLVVVIEGSELPGRRCRPDPQGHAYENVHVALCSRASAGSAANLPGRTYGVAQMRPGDADSARWELEVTLREGEDGVDFGGSYVLSKRGDRHLGLAWGEVAGDGSFELFRGAKLRLDRVEPDLIRRAATPGHRLVCRLGLTDEKGNPRCATVRPPHIRWSAERVAKAARSTR